MHLQTCRIYSIPIGSFSFQPLGIMDPTNDLGAGVFGLYIYDHHHHSTVDSSLELTTQHHSCSLVIAALYT